MNYMNERLAELRRHLGLTQAKFAEQINISQPQLGKIEKGQRVLTKRTISDICREFNVNEDWLRTGSGEMFVQPESFSLDDFARSRGATDFEVEIIKAYFELPEEIRKTVIEHFKGYLQKEKAAPAQLKVEPEPPSIDIEKEVEAYRQELLAERAAQKLSVSDAINIENI